MNRAKWIDVLSDNWQLTRSLDALRSTYPVRAEAIRRLGSTGANLSFIGRMINVLDNLPLVDLIVAIVATSH